MYIVSIILTAISIIVSGGTIYVLLTGAQVDLLNLIATMSVSVFLLLLATYFGVMNFLINIDQNTKEKKKD